MLAFRSAARTRPALTALAARGVSPLSTYTALPSMAAPSPKFAASRAHTSSAQESLCAAEVAAAAAEARAELNDVRDRLGDYHPRAMRATQKLANLLSNLEGSEFAAEAAAMQSQMRVISQGMYPR
jgi:hypothetical protein